MVATMIRNWAWVVLRGVLAILFGALTLLYPGVALTTLVLLFGAYALVDGVFRIVAALRSRGGEPHRFALLVGGVLGIVAGLITFFLPAVTGVALLAVIAAWAILTGIPEMVVAIRLRQEITGEWLLGLSGVMAVAFGVILIVTPVAGALAIAVWIGVYAMIIGVLLITLGLRLRSWGRLQHGGPTAHAA